MADRNSIDAFQLMLHPEDRDHPRGAPRPAQPGAPGPASPVVGEQAEGAHRDALAAPDHGLVQGGGHFWGI